VLEYQRIDNAGMETTYLRGHCSPLLVSTLVLQYIISLGEEEQENNHHVDSKQDTVATPVKWFVVLAVDVGRHDAAKLNTHWYQILDVTIQVRCYEELTVI
jgi:hypothetical protein